MANPVAFDAHGHIDDENDEEDGLGWEENDGAEHVSTKRHGGVRVPRHKKKCQKKSQNMLAGDPAKPATCKRGIETLLRCLC